jgi:hypothetical protein
MLEPVVVGDVIPDDTGDSVSDELDESQHTADTWLFISEEIRPCVLWAKVSERAIIKKMMVNPVTIPSCRRRRERSVNIEILLYCPI